MSQEGPVGAGEPGGGGVGRGPVVGLLIPADERGPVSLAVLRLTASSLSDAIGGGLLEEVLVGQAGGSGYTFYLDEQRVAKGLPPNGRARVLAVRLGQVNRSRLADLRGDALVLGCDDRLDDTNVPRSVVDTAARAGWRVQPADTDR